MILRLSLLLSLLLAPLSSFAYDSVDSHPNLSGGTSYWTLDEASGVRYDSDGSNNLSDTNTTGSATGILDLGGDFELSNSEYLYIADGSQVGLDSMVNLSMYCWVKPESTLSTGQRMIIMANYRMGDATNSQFPYEFSLNDSGGTKQLRAELYDGTNYANESVTYDAGTGVFHMVGVVYNNVANTAQFYADGVPVSSAQATGAMGNLQNSSAQFSMGAAGNGIGLGEDFFDGIIDECWIGDVVLSDQDMLDAYNGGDALVYEGAGEATSTPPGSGSSSTTVQAILELQHNLGFILLFIVFLLTLMSAGIIMSVWRHI